MVIVEKLVKWKLSGESDVLEKTCPSATLSTINPSWLEQVLNPGRRGGRPVTNRLSYGAAFVQERMNQVPTSERPVTGMRTGLFYEI
jgi:hypothetical protein